MENLSDAELVERCQIELPYDTTSFAILVHRYKQRVFAKIFLMVKNKHDAEDISQDVFLKVFQNLPAFRQDSSFSTWLYAITVNTCLNHIEKKQRRSVFTAAQSWDHLNESDREDRELFHLVSRRVEQAELRRSIEAVLAKLNAATQEILRLRFFDELDYDSISKKLNISASATKMRIKRAREEFIRQFENLRSSS